MGDVVPLYENVPQSKTGSPKMVKVMGILDRGILENEYNENGGVLLITTEQVYQKLAGENNYHRVTVTLKEGAGREPVANYLKQLNEEDSRYQYLDRLEQARRDRNSALAASVFLYGFVVVIALIGSLNIVNTISTSLMLRTRELSIMQAVGMTGGGLRKLVCLEGIFYGVIAAVYGGLLGTGLSYLLFRFLIRIREFEWTIPWNHIIIAVLGAVVIALLSSYIPLRKFNRGNIVENIRMEV